MVRLTLVTAALLLAASAVEAAEQKLPAGLAAARKALADAVAAKDAKAVAAMSAFPLVIDVYQMAPKIAEKQFGKGDLDVLFGGGDKGVLDCIRGGAVAKNDPKSDQAARRFGKSWYADCDGNNYFFAEKDGRWLFTGYQNVNE